MKSNEKSLVYSRSLPDTSFPSCVAVSICNLRMSRALRTGTSCSCYRTISEQLGGTAWFVQAVYCLETVQPGIASAIPHLLSIPRNFACASGLTFNSTGYLESCKVIGNKTPFRSLCCVKIWFSTALFEAVATLACSGSAWRATCTPAVHRINGERLPRQVPPCCPVRCSAAAEEEGID